MKRNARAIALNVATIALVLVSAGCGGAKATATASDADVQAGMTKAQALLADAQKTVTSVDALAPAPAVAPGKLMVTIPCSYAAEGCKRGVDAVAEAAGQLGWQTKMIDPAGDPEKMRQAVRTAIQLKAAGIFLGATPPDVVRADVANARAAGIKVVNMFEPADADFADAQSLTDHVQAGRWNAAYLTVATQGKGKLILVNDPEFPSVTEWHQGVVDGLKEFCPGCTIAKDISFQIANLQTQLPTEFQAALQANPGVNGVWVAYDPVAAAITPIIQRAANGSQIKVASHNGDPFALQYLKDGNKPLSATVAYCVEQQSYSAVDQMVRLLGGSLPADQKNRTVPEKLMTKDNVTSIPWNGDVDWKSAYLKAWKANGTAPQ